MKANTCWATHEIISILWHLKVCCLMTERNLKYKYTVFLGYDTTLMGNLIPTFWGYFDPWRWWLYLATKVGIWLPINTVSYSTKTECSVTLLPKPQNLRWILFTRSHPSSLRSILQYRVTTKWCNWQFNVSL